MSTPTPYDFVVVILSHGDRGFPHADALRASNPGLDIAEHVCEAEGDDAWRNCHRTIREWWKDRSWGVPARRVLFLEWDVLVNVDLRSIFPANRNLPGLEGAALRTRNRDARWWPVFQEVERLPVVMRPHAVGIAPLSVVMLSREALDGICGDQYAPVFALDVFCELCLPTMVKHLGFDVVGNRLLADVTCGPSYDPGSRRGVFHPVKGGVL